MLAGDIGVGPPGDEAEHEPNFALTAEAGGNDGLAAPLVLIGVFVAEEGGTGWIDKWLVADLVYACAAGVAIGAVVGCAAAWSVPALRDRELLAPAFDGYHAVATALVLYGAAEIAGGYGFLAVFAGGLAFRRYEHDHELNGRVHAGAEQVEKFMELAAILLLGSLLTGARADRARLGGVAARDRAARGHPPAQPCSSRSSARRSRRRAAGRSSRGSGCAGWGRSTTRRPS